MNYVTGIIMQFTTKEAEIVVVKARGNYVSRAVDVTTAATKRFLPGKIRIQGTVIDAETVMNKEGREVLVSSIEITLKRA